MKSILTIIILFLAQVCLAQSTTSQQGQWYMYWGWNGSHYTKSDITFTGSDHQFTLNNVVADDRQTKFTIKKYFHPEYFTTPQYNFRIGKYLKNNWDISLAIDHMKYVVRQGQSVTITGNITEANSTYNGVYNEDPIDITSDLLLYEHTDGLNYVNLGLRKKTSISKENQKAQLELIYGFGAGAIVPKSDVTLLGRQRHDAIHLSGYGIDVIAGLRLNLSKRWFLQTEVKSGYINLPNVRTTVDRTTNASQSFAYVQYNILFGGNMFLKKTKSINE